MVDVFEPDPVDVPKKKQKFNPLGENIYLLAFGLIKREEDSIICAQRIWKERVYSPPGTLFEKRGKMYRRSLENWKKNI